jgi:hypothetical protein
MDCGCMNLIGNLYSQGMRDNVSDALSDTIAVATGMRCHYRCCALPGVRARSQMFHLALKII